MLPNLVMGFRSLTLHPEKNNGHGTLSLILRLVSFCWPLSNGDMDVSATSWLNRRCRRPSEKARLAAEWLDGHRQRRMLIPSLLRVGVFLSILSSVLSGCVGSLCGNQELRRRASPDGKLVAVVFQRDCGATTGFSTQVTIIQNGVTLPNTIGRVFVSDDNPGIDVQWKGGDRLIVAVPDAAKRSLTTHRVSVRTGSASNASVTVEYVRAATP